MKLGGRELARLIARPEPDRAGILFYGTDPMRIALKRQDFLKALLGPQAEAEMRLTRLSVSDIRSDSARVLDEMKARGFFPGARAVFADDVTEAVAAPILSALADWQPGDAVLVVTAGGLRPTSKLRKAFETHRSAYAAPVYDDPMDRAEMEDALRKAGLNQISREAMSDLQALGQVLDPGDMRQTIEKVALYKHGDPTPLSAEELALLVPMTIEAAQDDLIHTVAEGQVARIGPLMTRLSGQGVAPVTLCIAATRHFRQLYAACADPKGPAAGIGGLRPPVFWKNRDRMIRQAQNWGGDKLAQALRILTETDLILRSSQMAPDHALIERAFIRLSRLSQRR